MRYLVTGSSGFIGQHVVTELHNRGHAPARLDTTHLGGVLDRDHLKRALKDCSGVINLAGALGTSELFGHERDAAEVNILGAINVYNAARAAGIPVVQIGTGHKGQRNVYAITKAAAEDLALARAEWQGEKIAVVRAYHVYGPGQPPPPPWGTSHVRKFFPTFACAALTGQPLELYGRGVQQIDPVHVTEVARVLVDALDGPYGEVIEAGTGHSITVRWVAGNIIRAVTGHTDPALLKPLNEARTGEPLGVRVAATNPACHQAWPYKVDETVAWYREWLASRQ